MSVRSIPTRQLISKHVNPHREGPYLHLNRLRRSCSLCSSACFRMWMKSMASSPAVPAGISRAANGAGFSPRLLLEPRGQVDQENCRNHIKDHLADVVDRQNDPARPESASMLAASPPMTIASRWLSCQSTLADSFLISKRALPTRTRPAMTINPLGDQRQVYLNEGITSLAKISSCSE
jgi:hypothetical protein